MEFVQRRHPNSSVWRVFLSAREEGGQSTVIDMNKQLLDPFESDYPERIEEELQYGNLHARCCAFNRRGTLLATGCHEGAAVLWDFDTRGVVKVLQVMRSCAKHGVPPTAYLF